MLADRPEALDAARRAQRAAATGAARCFDVGLRCTCGWATPAGGAASSRRREELLREANAALDAYGARPRPARVLRRVPDRGADRARRPRRGPRGARRRNRDHGRLRRTRARYWLHAQLAAARRRGAMGGGARRERRVRASASPPTRTPPGTPWRATRAEALDRLGRTDEARRARRGGARRRARVGRARRRSAARCTQLGRLERDAGLPRLEEAVAVLERLASRGWSTPARSLALGTALRHARRPADAREPLRRALELATSLRRAAARRRRPLGALRRGRAAAHGRARGRRGAHRVRAARRRPRGDGGHEPRHRPGALRDAEDRRGPPLQRLPQARHPVAPRAGRTALGAAS